MGHVEGTYLPAAGHDWMLPLYDPMVKLFGGDAARRALLEQAALESATRVLDVGCGTGSLLVLLARRHPGLQLAGIDPDPKALARAARKARRASASVQLDRGFSDAVPYPDASFDRVFSSFMLHHLGVADEKRRALQEMRRVLRPGGSLHLLDFAPPDDGHASGLMRWVHSHHRLGDNTVSRVTSLMQEAGFASVRVVRRGALFMGRTAYYEALPIG